MKRDRLIVAVPDNQPEEKAVRKNLVTLLMLAFLAWNVLAQVTSTENRDDEYSAIYAVTNTTVPAKSRIELWKYQVVAQVDKDNLLGTPRVYFGHEITRETFGKRGDAVTETTTIWYTETVAQGGIAYLKEIISPPTDTENPSRRMFGRVEKRDVKTDKLLESWPIFIEKEPCTHVCRIVITSFFPNGYIERIVREFRLTDYIFPFREIHTTIHESMVTDSQVYEKIK